MSEYIQYVSYFFLLVSGSQYISDVCTNLQFTDYHIKPQVYHHILWKLNYLIVPCRWVALQLHTMPFCHIGLQSLSYASLHIWSEFSNLNFHGDIVKPCIKEDLLAPTKKQCMEFSAWLRVFAKDYTVMSTRMANLVDDYNVCCPTWYYLLFFSIFYRNYLNNLLHKSICGHTRPRLIVYSTFMSQLTLVNPWSKKAIWAI